jgi:phosphoglycolate phosphatase
MKRRKPVRGLLFDLDGTLVDSAADLQSTLNHLLQEYSLPQLGLAQVKSMIGDGVAKLVERALVATGGDGVHVDKAARRFLELYEGHAVALTTAYPEVRDVLMYLHAQGFILAVVTNKPLAATREILTTLDLDHFFTTVVGGDSAPRRKPHPDPVLKALADIGLQSHEAMMIGDNYHDVEAAHAAGVDAIMVTYGYSHKPPSETGADYVVESMSEILACFQLATTTEAMRSS